MTESSLQAEPRVYELELARKIEQKEINIVQAFGNYRLKHEKILRRRKKEQGWRKAPSLKGFLRECCQSFQLVTLGYKRLDQLKLFGTAVFQSVPNAIRKRNLAIDMKLDLLTEKLCRKITVKANVAIYQVRDYEGLKIVSSEFEPFMSDWFQPKHGEVFVDIGSHIGKYALEASKAVGDLGFVVAIEAHPSNFVLLENNIKLNKAKNIKGFNLAAWDKQRELKLSIGNNSATSNISRFCYGKGFIDVQAEKVDKLLLKDLDLKRVDWIKIDVEGAECEVLHGLEETLSKHRPKLIIEVWSKNANYVSAILNRHNYVSTRCSEFGEAQSEYFTNILAFPKACAFKARADRQTAI